MDYINQIICGDCIEVMKGFPDNYIDTIITDPPYGLKFMGKKWDYDVPSVEVWQECLRVLKPGGTALIFAGSRTQHRMACNVEDAGFILKDIIEDLYQPDIRAFYEYLLYFNDGGLTKAFLRLLGGNELFWLYGSGFPKATDISKQIDKMAGAKREVIGKHPNPAGSKGNTFPLEQDCNITAPATPEATLWDGWKSHGLKPAYEPILVAMKPNEGSYANNAMKYGVAGLNIDGGRIGTETIPAQKRGNAVNVSFQSGGFTPEHKGRFPANIILDEEAARLLDEQAPETGAFAKVKSGHSGKSKGIYNDYAQRGDDGETFYADGLQGASRFFYCAKASKAERNRGCEGLEKIERIRQGLAGEHKNTFSKNSHPTVKPLALMKYLCTLTKTPTGGIVLDPFCGSGTTLMACKETGRDYIGIEKDSEYVEIAKCRVRAIPELLF